MSTMTAHSKIADNFCSSEMYAEMRAVQQLKYLHQQTSWTGSKPHPSVPALTAALQDFMREQQARRDTKATAAAQPQEPRTRVVCLTRSTVKKRVSYPDAQLQPLRIGVDIYSSELHAVYLKHLRRRQEKTSKYGHPFWCSKPDPLVRALTVAVQDFRKEQEARRNTEPEPTAQPEQPHVRIVCESKVNICIPTSDKEKEKAQDFTTAPRDEPHHSTLQKEESNRTQLPGPNLEDRGDNHTIANKSAPRRRWWWKAGRRTTEKEPELSAQQQQPRVRVVCKKKATSRPTASEMELEKEEYY